MPEKIILPSLIRLAIGIVNISSNSYFVLYTDLKHPMTNLGISIHYAIDPPNS